MCNMYDNVLVIKLSDIGATHWVVPHSVNTLYTWANPVRRYNECLVLWSRAFIWLLPLPWWTGDSVHDASVLPSAFISCLRWYLPDTREFACTHHQKSHQKSKNECSTVSCIYHFLFHGHRFVHWNHILSMHVYKLHHTANSAHQQIKTTYW